MTVKRREPQAATVYLTHSVTNGTDVGNTVGRHGAPGFLGRWLDYAATDHGGNANVKDKAAAVLDVTVLGQQSGERASSTAS